MFHLALTTICDQIIILSDIDEGINLLLGNEKKMFFKNIYKALLSKFTFMKKCVQVLFTKL